MSKNQWIRKAVFAQTFLLVVREVSVTTESIALLKVEGVCVLETKLKSP